MNSLNNVQLFDRYTIRRGKSEQDEYEATRLLSNGKDTALSDTEKNELFTTEMLAGSIGFTRDTNHVGWLHKCIYAMQNIHRKITGSHFVDPNLCHGVIVMNPADNDKKLEQGDCNPRVKKITKKAQHPFIIGHAVFSGIQTSKRDYMTDPQVTEFIVYRPKDDQIRKLILEQTKATCHSVKGDCTAKQKAKFALSDLAISAFNNRKHKVCTKKGPIPKAIMERTAFAMADYLLKNQILDRKERPKALICSGYTAYVLQVALIAKNLLGQNLEPFIQGNNRQQLADKILNAINGKLNDPIAKTINEAYWASKLARYDARFAMSCYLGKMLDKQSMVSTESDKAHIFPYQTKKANCLKRFVTWYKSAGLPAAAKKVVAYVGAFFFALITVGCGIPLILKINKIAKKIDLEQRAAAYKVCVSPPSADKQFTSDTRVCNSINEYAIDNDHIWVRRLEKDAQWKHIYFDGKPVKLSIEGSILRITNDKGVVYNKKLTLEARGYKAINHPKIKRHINFDNLQVNIRDKKTLVIIDKSQII